MIPSWLKRPAPRPVTVDRAARDQMARLVRELATRRIDNFAFEKYAEEIAFQAADDPALLETLDFCWGYYSDIRRHLISKLPRDHRRAFARLILFLRSDEPYCWVSSSSASRGLSHWSSTIGDALIYVIAGLKLPILGVLSVVLRVWMYFTPDHVAPRLPVEAEREQSWPFPDLASLRRAEDEMILLRGLPCA